MPSELERVLSRASEQNTEDEEAIGLDYASVTDRVKRLLDAKIKETEVKQAGELIRSSLFNEGENGNASQENHSNSKPLELGMEAMQDAMRLDRERASEEKHDKDSLMMAMVNKMMEGNNQESSGGDINQMMQMMQFLEEKNQKEKQQMLDVLQRAEEGGKQENKFMEAVQQKALEKMLNEDEGEQPGPMEQAYNMFQVMGQFNDEFGLFDSGDDNVPLEAQIELEKMKLEDERERERIQREMEAEERKQQTLNNTLQFVQDGVQAFVASMAEKGVLGGEGPEQQSTGGNPQPSQPKQPQQQGVMYTCSDCGEEWAMKELHEKVTCPGCGIEQQVVEE